MAPEDMGKISQQIRFALALFTVVFVAVLAISPMKDSLREWKSTQRHYVRFVQTRPDTKHLLADFQPGIDQIWIPEMNVVDRCTTCHAGIAETNLAGASVPVPFRAHPPVPHSVREWGCTICHRGQGPATEFEEAHHTTLAWEQPMLPTKYLQASCGACHQDDRPETPQLDRGRELLAKFNCIGCHRLQEIDRPEMLGPDLTNIGTKVSREWIYKWLKEPRTLVDKDGNVTVDGYETSDEPRMPKFQLTEVELRAISGYLSTLKSKPITPYLFSAAVLAKWEKNPELAAAGETRFRQMFCSTCHSLAVARAGETKLIGGDIGPELTKVGSKVNQDWLVAWLREPQAYLPHSQMPRYEWSDEDLYQVTKYITTSLTDSDLLTDVPPLGPASAEQVALGHRLFVEKGCASCHVASGVPQPNDFGPDLSSLGAKSVSQMEFGKSNILRNLISYIQAKISDPASVNPAARMPQFTLTPSDLDAITTALLSMTGQPANGRMEQLRVARPAFSFRPAGEFRQVYSRYKCYVCHQFNGYGGDLAPDLSYEGSRAQRNWLVEFLKNPQTLRPMLVLRMPQFNMTDHDANVLADYLEMVLQDPDVNVGALDRSAFTQQMAALGKQLYEVKFQCQSCHTIGSAGGYVGPNLNNVGNWMNPEWIEAWLRNPQALVPATIEPRRVFTDEEITALTAYLMTLRQSGSAHDQVHRATTGAGQ